MADDANSAGIGSKAIAQDAFEPVKRYDSDVTSTVLFITLAIWFAYKV